MFSPGYAAVNIILSIFAVSVRVTEVAAMCPTPSEKEDFVKRIIIEIIRGEIEKPEWMKYVEEEMSCNCCNAAPSTFLFLIPKDEKYRTLAARLLDFLYSPNMMTTELK